MKGNIEWAAIIFGVLFVAGCILVDIDVNVNITDKPIIQNNTNPKLADIDRNSGKDHTAKVKERK